ncbi:MAG: hypothetical protein CVU14_12840 [Bacteroidetes bacterium HGW-Bacteroidetes-9]|jgi:hypothetical protein|nr:MAG: hypothetical protein CVU14_12840 [Bacteroidetes bacterium HGW-Bacteroidetes-9]
MGYMGFGMQKWIYRRKPRHPFAKKTEPGYDTLPSHSPGEFVSYGSPSKNLRSIDERIRNGKEKLRSRWQRSHWLNIAFVIFLISIIGYIILKFVGQNI